jgi:hypothetical protein
VAWFRYGVIERALADVLQVGPAKIGAFRARLRHLRNINCPKLPKTGSGQPVLITREQAIEILIALELVALGIAPRYAVEHAKEYAEVVADPERDTVTRGDRLIVRPAHDFLGNDHELTRALVDSNDLKSRTSIDEGAMISLQRITPSLMNKLLTSGTFAVVNVARSVHLLDRALRRVTTELRVELSEEERRYMESEC